MDGIAKKQTYGGAAKSLQDFGYSDVGLDDHWQDCGSKLAAPGMNYHDAQGNPLINLKVFPDLGAMAAHAHSLKLTSGWYGNNCDCSDHCDKATNSSRGQGEVCDMQMKQDVNALVKKYNFDVRRPPAPAPHTHTTFCCSARASPPTPSPRRSTLQGWKLDGCGGEYDLVAINKEIKAAGKAIMVENCHWGGTIPDRSKPEEVRHADANPVQDRRTRATRFAEWINGLRPGPIFPWVRE